MATCQGKYKDGRSCPNNAKYGIYCGRHKDPTVAETVTEEEVQIELPSPPTRSNEERIQELETARIASTKRFEEGRRRMDSHEKEIGQIGGLVRKLYEMLNNTEKVLEAKAEEAKAEQPKPDAEELFQVEYWFRNASGGHTCERTILMNQDKYVDQLKYWNSKEKNDELKSGKKPGFFYRFEKVRPIGDGYTLRVYLSMPYRPEKR